MGLDITIRAREGGSLGSTEQIRQKLLGAFPSIQFGREPGGADKVAAAEASGVKFPEFLREQLAQLLPYEAAEFQGQGFSIQLRWSIEEPVREISAAAYFG